jgi:fatty acid desaturase
MAMGRSVPPPPPEEADSWGEFHARLELEAADNGQPLIPLWWTVAGILFAIALICCAYALQGGRWWLWVAMLGLLGILGTLAVRAVERADRQAARTAELGRLRDAWEDHARRGSPTQ